MPCIWLAVAQAGIVGGEGPRLSWPPGFLGHMTVSVVRGLRRMAVPPRSQGEM